MRTGISGWWVAGMLLGSSLMTGAMGCTAATDEAGDDDGGGGGGGGGSSGGWTQVPLLDDNTIPDRTTFRAGIDRVSGIYYSSRDKGVIVSQAGGTSARGGAVFLANGSKATSIAFSGDDTGLRLRGPIDFTGIQPTSTGFVAMAYASDVIASHDGGATFAIAKNGQTDTSGIERVLGFSESATGTTIVRGSGVVTTMGSAPGPSAVFTDVWAPNATEPIPAALQPGECEGGPFGSGQPSTRYSVHVSADRQFIAYASNLAQDAPQICISRDGGWSFYAHLLDVPSTSESRVPSGVLFTSATTGIAWFGGTNASAYIRRTTDGGEHWTSVALPSELGSADVELPVGFFAPDGQHGWLAGYSHDGSGYAVALATADGGATWKMVPGVGDAVAKLKGGKLYAGFALDAEHIWLGGDNGLVMHN